MDINALLAVGTEIADKVAQNLANESMAYWFLYALGICGTGAVTTIIWLVRQHDKLMQKADAERDMTRKELMSFAEANATALANSSNVINQNNTLLREMKDIFAEVKARLK